MINKLYAILTCDAPEAGPAEYAKKYTAVYLTDRMRDIKTVLLKGVPSSKLLFVAGAVCYLSLKTSYGDELRKADPENTYFKPEPPSHPVSSSTTLVDVVRPELEQELRPYLDADIAESLVTPLWHEVMAAGCLQLLREADKA